jgi:ubiquinone/menaquinone biosynthesis C-methylase UbiE
MLKILFSLKRILPRFLFAPIRRYFWRVYWAKEREVEKRELGKEAPDGPVLDSERAVLLEKIVDQHPFEALIEVACSWGQNFFTLSEFFPDTPFVGIDRDEEAIAYGRNIFASKGRDNISLHLTDARNLSMFEDKSFDLVVSCAFLLYVWPDDVAPVLREMFRVGRRKIILMEQHKPNPPGNKNYIGTFHNFKLQVPGYWVRDYQELFLQYVEAPKIKLTKVKNPRWPQEQWKDLAHLIEIDLE